MSVPGVATVSDVIVSGGLSPNDQRGIQIAHSTGRFNFDRMRLENLDNDAMVVSAANANVSLTNSQIIDAQPRAILVSGSAARVIVDNTTILGTSGRPGTSTIPPILGTAIEAAGTGSRVTVANSTLSGTATATGTNAITDRGLVASGTNSTIIAVNTTVERLRGPAVVASGEDSTISGTNMRVQRIDGDGLVSSGSGANIILTSSTLSRIAGFGALVTGTGSGLYLTGSSRIELAESDGIHVIGRNNTVLLEDSRVTNSSVNGVYVRPEFGSTSTQVTLLRSRVSDSGGVGVWAQGVGSPANGADRGVVQIFSSIINTAQTGVLVQNSSVDIGRTPNDAASPGSRISGSGAVGILASGDGQGFSALRVRDSEITGWDTGIQMRGAPGQPDTNPFPLPVPPPATPPAERTNNLIAISNRISANDTGIELIGRHDITAGNPALFVSAQIRQNRITTPAAGDDISLEVLAPPGPTDPVLRFPITLQDVTSSLELSAFNLGADVDLTPPGPASLYYSNSRIPVAPPVRPIPRIPDLSP
jgi:hypothetical protein